MVARAQNVNADAVKQAAAAAVVPDAESEMITV